LKYIIFTAKKTILQKLVYAFLTIIGLLPISNLCAQPWEAGSNIGTMGYLTPPPPSGNSLDCLGMIGELKGSWGIGGKIEDQTELSHNIDKIGINYGTSFLKDVVSSTGKCTMN
jgi:hypothetical protein